MAKNSPDKNGPTARRRSRAKILSKIFLIVCLSALALAGPGSSGRGALAAAPAPLKLRPADGSILVGAYEPRKRVGNSSFERTIGRRMAVFNTFQAWGGTDSTFTSEWAGAVKKLHAKGQVLMITWEPWKPGDGADQPNYRLKTIAEGKHDKYMRRWFKKVRALRKPIFVRFAHEMNGDWYPWGTHVNKPSEYVAAWRHMVDLSRQVGANNITWVWSPNEHQREDYLAQLYPGKRYVDWIGISGFNWGGRDRDWTGWRSAKRIFGPTLAFIKKYKKPIMIAEIGVPENPRVSPTGPKTKAAWIAKTYNYLKNVKPKVSLIVYHNVSDCQPHDWRITTSRASRMAIRRALADPRFFGLLRAE